MLVDVTARHFPVVGSRPAAEVRAYVRCNDPETGREALGGRVTKKLAADHRALTYGFENEIPKIKRATAAAPVVGNNGSRSRVRRLARSRRGIQDV